MSRIKQIKEGLINKLVWTHQNNTKAKLAFDGTVFETDKGVRLPDGSAAAPSLSFDSNPYCGIFSTTNCVNFATAGCERVIIDGSGNLTLTGGTGAITGTTTLIFDMPVTTPGAGFNASGGVIWIPYGKLGASGMYVTEVYINLADAVVTSKGTVTDIIGEAAGGAAYIGQITVANHGTIVAMIITCLETPATGDDDIDFYSATAGTGVYDGLITDLVETKLYERAAAWAAGDVKVAAALPTANEYLYLTSGNGDTAGAYSTGKFLITFYGK